MNKETIAPAGRRSSFYWRLWLRSLTVKRPQAVLAITSLLVGATVASMLLNLYGDARRKMTQEFRAYGPNVVLAPSDSVATPGQDLPAAAQARANNLGTVSGVIDEQVMDRLAPLEKQGNGFAAVPVLYVVTQVRKAPGASGNDEGQRQDPENVVAVGTDFEALHRLYPAWQIEVIAGVSKDPSCVIGAHIASRLRLGLGDSVELNTLAASAGRPEIAPQSYRVSSIVSTGTSEDDEVFVSLPALQRLSALTGKISLVELSVPGEAAEVESVIGGLQQTLSAIPNIELRPIRQIIYSAGRVLDTIRWVMLSLASLILIIIVLCVMATMTAIVPRAPQGHRGDEIAGRERSPGDAALFE